MMRVMILSAMAALISACSGEAASGPSAGAEKAAKPVDLTRLAEDTRVAAVMVHADWCSSCKIVWPKLNEAKAKGEIDGLQHVVLDYTKKDADAFFADADTVGVGAAMRDVFENGKVKTGLFFLIDVKTQKVLGKLRRDNTTEEFRTEMEASVKA